MFVWREFEELILNVFGLNTVSFHPFVSVKSWFLKSLINEGAFVVTAKALPDKRSDDVLINNTSNERIIFFIYNRQDIIKKLYFLDVYT